jgi:hypothetical protein
VEAGREVGPFFFVFSIRQPISVETSREVVAQSQWTDPSDFQSYMPSISGNKNSHTVMCMLRCYLALPERSHAVRPPLPLPPRETPVKPSCWDRNGHYVSCVLLGAERPHVLDRCHLTRIHAAFAPSTQISHPERQARARQLPASRTMAWRSLLRCSHYGH